MERTRNLLILLALLGSAAFVTGCNTVEGAGRDVQSLGQSIEETAEDAEAEWDDEVD